MTSGWTFWIGGILQDRLGIVFGYGMGDSLSTERMEILSHSYEEHEISGVDPQREEQGCSGAILEKFTPIYTSRKK